MHSATLHCKKVAQPYLPLSSSVITHERSQNIMKGVTIFFAGILVLGVLSYFGLLAVNEHIDRESGAIVEQTLSDNTVNQLMVMSEIQSQIEAGNIQQASEKLAESINTLKYILKNNCNLAKCEKALSDYERR